MRCGSMSHPFVSQPRNDPASEAVARTSAQRRKRVTWLDPGGTKCCFGDRRRGLKSWIGKTTHPIPHPPSTGMASREEIRSSSALRNPTPIQLDRHAIRRPRVRNYLPLRRFSSTATRAATPCVTCRRIRTPPCSSATASSISMPRFTGPGCSTTACGRSLAARSAVRP